MFISWDQILVIVDGLYYSRKEIEQKQEDDARKLELARWGNDNFFPVILFHVVVKSATAIVVCMKVLGVCVDSLEVGNNWLFVNMKSFCKVNFK